MTNLLQDHHATVAAVQKMVHGVDKSTERG